MNLLISIVLPVYNEAASLPELLRRIHTVLSETEGGYEIIAVDDGSSDETALVLQNLRRDFPTLRLVRLARNFGKEAALSAGIDMARGQAVITMDSDLQHPPEMLPDLIGAWRNGASIVMTVRQNRQIDNRMRRILTKFYYKLMSWLSEVKIPVGLGDFNLYDRKVVAALKHMPERTRYMKGIVSWIGYKRALIPLSAAPRLHGNSQFSFLRLLRLAMIGITAFSNLPLKIWSGLGLAISLLALGYGIYVAIWTALHGIDVPGYASLMVAVVFLGGVQLISLGVIGEYLGRVFTEVKRRPLYLVAEREGFEDEA